MMPRRQRALDILVIIILTLLIGCILILACGANPAEAFLLFIQGIFKNKSSMVEVLVKACPLILTALGCSVAYRTGFFTIGAEGQFYVGAMVTAMLSLNLTPVPGVPRIVLALAGGFIGGGLWALIAAVLKARFDISEIIITIMLNYIAIYFLGYAVRSFLMDPEGNVPQSAKIPQDGQLRIMFTGTRFHPGIIIAVLCVIAVWFLMTRMTVGYELKVVGLNQRAAAVNGISVMKNIILSAFLSGGFAALAGGIEVLAVQKKLLEGISAECGYTAVLIALIAGNHPLGVLAAAVVYAAVQTVAGSMQRQLGVPSSIVNILIGAVVILILAKDLFHLKGKHSRQQTGRMEKPDGGSRPAGNQAGGSPGNHADGPQGVPDRKGGSQI